MEVEQAEAEVVATPAATLDSLSHHVPDIAPDRTAGTDPRLCNDGRGVLTVPGFSGIPIDLEFYAENRFTRGGNEWAQQPNLTARELAMLRLMNDMTEEHHWHGKIFDKAMVEGWRGWALSRPLISPKAWDWCLIELRDKVLIFKQTGTIVVFNTAAGVVKSDAVAESIRIELNDGIALLEARQDSEQQVMHNLIDPGLFPLVYGRTHVLMHSGRVTLDKSLDLCGQGEVVPEFPSDYFHHPRPFLTYKDKFEEVRVITTHWGLKKWSARFQWLPCEVEFENESGTDVRITSYVNNLHPVRFRASYGTIAKLISRSIEPWNQILMKQMRGRTPLRIRTYGVEPQNQIPEWATREKFKELERDRNSEAFKNIVHRIKEWLTLPEDDEILERVTSKVPPTWEKDDQGLWKAFTAKRERLRLWRHPEPGTAFSYNEWKAGSVGKTIIDRKIDTPNVDAQHNFYQVSLQDSFRKQGLQVVVKISSIELTPDNPSFGGTEWQLDGMMNDHIVASALYVFDVKNVTEARLSFRQETRMRREEFRYNKWSPESLMAVFAIPGDCEDVSEELMASHPPSLQELGSVPAPQGRLLAWPNVLHHRTEPIRLIDPTTSGHCKSISLYLVDPHYRVCSTLNVPPQQHDWWVGEALESTRATQRGIPQELIDQIEIGTDNWPMGMDEAEQLKLELAKEKGAADKYIMNSGAGRYVF